MSINRYEEDMNRRMEDPLEANCMDCVRCVETCPDPPGGLTPSQYAIPPKAEQLQDLIEYRNMNFAIGNIFKACYREKESVDKLYEIRKIIWFAKREERRLLKLED